MSSGVLTYLLGFSLDIVAACILLFVGSCARSKTAVIAWGIVGAGLATLQILVFYALIGTGESWGAASGQETFLGVLTLVSVAGIVAYFVWALGRVHREQKLRKGSGRGHNIRD